MYQDRADVVTLLAAGARLAVCVPERAVADVKQTLSSIVEECGAAKAPRANAEDQGKDTIAEASQAQLEGAWHVWYTSK